MLLFRRDGVLGSTFRALTASQKRDAVLKKKIGESDPASLLVPSLPFFHVKEYIFLLERPFVFASPCRSFFTVVFFIYKCTKICV